MKKFLRILFDAAIIIGFISTLVAFKIYFERRTQVQGMLCQVGPHAAQQPSFVVRVIVDQGIIKLRGSGTLIRNDLILTSYTLIQDRKAAEKITVRFLGGLEQEAILIKTDPTLKLALLKTKPVLHKEVSPSILRASKHDIVTICGIPIAGQYTEVTGEVVAYRTIRKNENREMFLVSNKSIAGMFGGPVLNMSGDIVGILYESLTYSNCTDLEALKKFLRDVE